MDASRLIAWVAGLVAVALGIAVLATDTTFFEYLSRLAVEIPNVPTNLGALVKETNLIGRGLLAFVLVLVLLWIKLR